MHRVLVVDDEPGVQESLRMLLKDECEVVTAGNADEAIVAIDAKPPDQLDLWKSDELEQRERNRESLDARLEEIPAEIEREAGEIARRYADPTPRVFPVSITFLVPASMSR